MSDIEQSIIDYLESTHEADIMQIMAAIQIKSINPRQMIAATLGRLCKQGLLKKYPNTKYRIVKAQPEKNQINLF